MQKAAKLPKSKAQGKEKQSHKNKAKKGKPSYKNFQADREKRSAFINENTKK